MRKINLSKDLLEELYVDKHLTLKAIAKELGTSRQTIANKLKEFGITIYNSEYIRTHKPPKRKLRRKLRYRDKETFEKVYHEFKSIYAVAEYFGINQKTAYEWKKRHGIDSIDNYKSREKNKPDSSKPYTNKEWLEEMYSKYSWEDLGAMLGVHPTTLSKWGLHFGIITRKPSEQWDLKEKFGNKVLHNGEIDLDAYNTVYRSDKKTHLSGKVKIAIIALYGRCENPNCNETEVLDVHHIDENHGNNGCENLAVLCPNCHAKIHRLGIPFKVLVPEHISWDKLLKYQEAK